MESFTNKTHLVVYCENEDQTNEFVRFYNPRSVGGYGHFNKVFYDGVSDDNLVGYTTKEDRIRHLPVLTFEEWKEKVVNRQKSITEYRVKAKYNNLSKALYSSFKIDSKGGWGRFDSDSILKEQYEEAGVLDLWFEPIYKNTLPTVNGHQGIDDEDVIKFGCARIPKSWFDDTAAKDFNRSIKSFTLTNGVKFSEEDVNAVREYLSYKKENK